MANFIRDSSITSKPKKWYRRRWGIVLIISLILIIVIGLIFINQVRVLVGKINRGEINLEEAAEEFTKTNSSSVQPGSAQVSPDDDPFLGSLGAKVTIIGFSDFQCPFSRKSFPVIKEVVDKYGDKIKFVYRDFPVSDSHPLAVKAAEAADCANDQGKFWVMHDKIFLNQDQLKEAGDLKKFALQIGLDEKKFNSCLDSGRYAAEVQKDLSDGLDAGVGGTPTWFINGRKYIGTLPLEAFEQIIDLELKNN